MRTIELTEQDYTAIRQELIAFADGSEEYREHRYVELGYTSQGVQFTCDYIESTTLLGMSGNGLTEPLEVDYLVNMEVTDLQALDTETDEAVEIAGIDWKKLRTNVRC